MALHSVEMERESPSTVQRPQSAVCVVMGNVKWFLLGFDTVRCAKFTFNRAAAKSMSFK